MKQFLKKIILFIKTILGLLEWFFQQIINWSWTYSRIERRQERKMRILANGPSLNDEIQELDFDEDCDYCMVNFSVMQPLFAQVKPSIYVLADPLFFTKVLVEKNNDLLAKFNCVDWKMALYVPTSVHSNARKLFAHNKNIEIKTLPASLSSLVTSRKIRVSFYKRGMACPILQNVLVGAIYASIMKGYKNICLYGVGHSWTSQIAVDELNRVCLKDVHFYNPNATMKPWVINGEPFRMHEVLRALAQMFDSYWEIRALIEDLGDVRIVNKTKESFIDAFERD